MKIAVIGAGIMGHGIAQVFAQAGHDVNLMSRTTESLTRAVSLIGGSLKKFAEKGILKEPSSRVFDRIRFTHILTEAIKDVDFIMEAIPEKFIAKSELLGVVTKSEVITATNTSSFSITDLAKETWCPPKFCGMHFFNPPQLMNLVEVVMGKYTSYKTQGFIIDLASGLGKTPIVSKDHSIVNRVLFPALDEAISLYFNGFGKENIDTALKLGLNLKMGLLELSDFIGNDTVLSIMKVLRENTPCNYRCIPHLEKMVVERGQLGRKSGRGFYEY